MCAMCDMIPTRPGLYDVNWVDEFAEPHVTRVHVGGVGRDKDNLPPIYRLPSEGLREIDRNTEPALFERLAEWRRVEI